MSGRWSSARGDTLHFTNLRYSLKWNSSSDKKLVVVDDDENNQLAATLASFASTNTPVQNEVKTPKHVDDSNTDSDKNEDNRKTIPQKRRSIMMRNF